MKKITITEVNSLTGTVVGAKAVLFEMLAFAYARGLEFQPIEYMSNGHVFLDGNNVYEFNAEGIDALIREAQEQGIKLSCREGEVSPLVWTMELMND